MCFQVLLMWALSIQQTNQETARCKQVQLSRYINRLMPVNQQMLVQPAACLCSLLCTRVVFVKELPKLHHGAYVLIPLVSSSRGTAPMTIPSYCVVAHMCAKIVDEGEGETADRSQLRLTKLLLP